jgi:hypothetical protein
MPNDWRLSYPGVDLPFGSIESGIIFQSAPEVGSPSIESDDSVRPRADGVAFGLDFHGGRTVTFDLAVNGSTTEESRARLGVLARAWRADVVRNTPGAVASLTSDTGRTTFGRPRRFSADDEFLGQGLSEVIADFSSSDSLWYGPQEDAFVALVPPPSGGLMSPLAWPLTTTASSDRRMVIDVVGEVDTWPVIEIRGPITNPEVEVLNSFRLAFRVSLAYDETLVVDTRPWARTILRGSASARGTLSRLGSRLDEARLAPGRHEVVLRGVSDTATASASLRWSPAFTTP